MSGCECKSGFFALRDCTQPVAARCPVCRRAMCRQHAADVQLSVCLDCAAGKHAWCRCQRSASYPLCDGSHRAAPAADGAPAPTPLKVTFDAPRRVAWCACGKTSNAPFCDGSHARGRANG